MTLNTVKDGTLVTEICYVVYRATSTKLIRVGRVCFVVVVVVFLGGGGGRSKNFDQLNYILMYSLTQQLLLFKTPS